MFLNGLQSSSYGVLPKSLVITVFLSDFSLQNWPGSELFLSKTPVSALANGYLSILDKWQWLPVFFNRANPTSAVSQRHCQVLTYVQINSFNSFWFWGQVVNWAGMFFVFYIPQQESMVPVCTSNVLFPCLLFPSGLRFEPAVTTKEKSTQTTDLYRKTTHIFIVWLKQQRMKLAKRSISKAWDIRQDHAA